MTLEGELIERVAALEHEQWLFWAIGVIDEVSPERRERWRRTMMVPYSDLTEQAKEEDREWARKAIYALAGVEHEHGFAALVAIATLLLDTYYPASIFTGVSGDLGPRIVVALRAVLAEHRAMP